LNSLRFFHHFMQSQPTEVSKTIPTDVQSQGSQDRQHGFDSHDQPTPLPPLAGIGGEVYQGPLPGADLGEPYLTELYESTETSPGGLNTERFQRNSCPVDRITEYERAWTPSPKQISQGPSFKVVLRQHATASRVPLGNFPNGMLQSQLVLRNDKFLI
jgi:hypothetical protein